MHFTLLIDQSAHLKAFLICCIVINNDHLFRIKIHLPVDHRQKNKIWTAICFTGSNTLCTLFFSAFTSASVITFTEQQQSEPSEFVTNSAQRARRGTLYSDQSINRLEMNVWIICDCFTVCCTKAHTICTKQTSCLYPGVTTALSTDRSCKFSTNIIFLLNVTYLISLSLTHKHLDSSPCSTKVDLILTLILTQSIRTCSSLLWSITVSNALWQIFTKSMNLLPGLGWLNSPF